MAIERRITTGNVLSIAVNVATLIGGVVAIMWAVGDFRAELARNAQADQGRDERITQMQASVQRDIDRIERQHAENLKDIRDLLTRIEAKLDTKADKP